jgi:serine/threonine protein kinase
MVGRNLSYYKILGLLAEGGMGILYRAVDTRLDRQVAIKVLRPEAISSEERKTCFIREAKAASALNHPSIVTIFDIGTEAVEGREVDYIAMELVEGEALSKRIEGACLSSKASITRGKSPMH